ncbi:MAG: MBL fold metallo-hydrolase [Prevotella sp.]|nr:MBL fold metallo-hydrolase [Prevotella sp.]MDD7272695.1 MBL fold metallo-hydrolase [Prevotellaceae bacterium]MDY3936420.1 MBL fold metallo-hydrolase [Prevotella sp.]MDY4217207.1 MBL fold metallo-hydrolase [Prevotella sp.]
MIEIKKFICNRLEENCYLLWDETKEAVLIDCGAFFEDERKEIVQFIRNNHLTLKHLLATHGHIDHHFGIDTIYAEFGLRPSVSCKDTQLMNSLPDQAMLLLHMEIENTFPEPAHFFAEKEEICFGNQRLQIIETPGHTQGSVTFYHPTEHLAFTGDTLFRGSVGRTDLPGGNMFQIINSLRELCQLPDQTRVFPGHGPETSIGFELAHNPYLDR